ncbi:3-dehydroquinate synthase [Chloroflexota bacterium]
MSVKREGSIRYSSQAIQLDTVRSWPIVVGAGILTQLEKHFDFSGYSSIILITDVNVAKLYGQTIQESLKGTGKKVHVLTLPPGEKTKSLRSAELAYHFLMDNNIDRRAVICTLGGGVIGDLGGYIAATYLRGVEYIQLPTTLLAQVDSSIGGKVGVNFGGKKNMVGSFYQPRAIISDVSCLQSLAPAEMRNGMAEVIKYGAAMDEKLFSQLEQMSGKAFSRADMADIVMRCSALKAAIVEADETERSGQRAILNFGHTVGHAIEAVARFRGQSHGKAVAIGMVAAARLSERSGRLDASSANRIGRVLQRFGLPVSCYGTKPEELVAAIHFDKKTVMGRTGWVLLKGIGKGVVNQPVAEEVVKGVLKEICR